MGSNLPSRSPYRHPTYDDTPGDEDADVVMPLSSLFLDELREDDTTTVYTYYSTWSTNYTMSNLVGPGRLLGNFYSRAGRSLEKRLRRVVNRAAIKEYKDAVGVLQSANFYATFDSDDPNEHEKACKALLTCARTDDIQIQAEAFEKIVRSFVYRPSKFQSAFRSVFEQHKEVSDISSMFSWKRLGVEYSIKWVFWSKLASRCLSSHWNSFVHATILVPFDGLGKQSLDFSHFEKLLLSCGDTSDVLLALHFISRYWDRKGVEIYIWSKAYKEQVIVQFTNGLLACWEVEFPETCPKVRCFSSGLILELGNKLLEGVTRSSQEVESGGPNGRWLYDARLAMWAGLFKLHQFLRRSTFFVEPENHAFVCKSWGDLCHESLPNPEQAKLRQSLLGTEDIYGPDMRRQFPPEKYSVIDHEETFFFNMARAIPGLVPCTHCSNPRELELDLRQRYWGKPSWYDDQLRICDYYRIGIESMSTSSMSAAGVPYITVVGRAAPNGCNVCYNTLRPGEADPHPTLLLLTDHIGIRKFLILRSKTKPDWFTSLDEDSKYNSFEGGFMIARNEIVRAAYLDK